MAAVEQLITDNLDIWSSAIKSKSAAGRGTSKKIELYGIKKLRELILELAVRGLLVPQDANDEPASELLKRIAVEKAKLVKEGKIKKPKVLPEIGEDEKPFELPMGWEWCRLIDAYDVRDGTHDTPKYVADGYPLVTSKNLSSGRLDFSDIKYISEDDHNKIMARSNVELDDILFAMIGSIGNPVLVDTDLEFSIKNVALFKYYLRELSAPDFLLRFLLYAEGIFKKQASGAVQSFVSLGKIRGFLIALPPIKEQHRIVTKVDELMALCDQLEQQTEDNISAHQTLVQTLLGTLTNTSERDGFAQAWARIAEHFDTLFTNEWSIDLLKQTILQLAVMGKLVRQDPNDEPASELLKKIAAEKARLVKEGEIKKQKLLPPIAEDEKPFELPVGWEWARLGNCSYIFTGNSFKSGDFNEEGGVRVIKITNAGVGELIETNDFLPESFLNDHESYKVIEGDLILALTRPYISSGLKISSCPPSYNNSLLNQRVAAIRAFLDTSFLYQYMQSVYVLGLYQARFGNSGLQPNLKMGDVTDLVMPVPPEEEQHRIVKKVNELMSLCDTLKSQLNTAQSTQLQLADAMADQAVA